MSLRNLILFVVATLAVLVSAGRAEIKVGDPFPRLSAAHLTPLSGDPLPELSGQVVLVDFWASWCAPCKASFPALAKLHADYAARGLTVIGVSVDDDRAAAAAFWKRMKAPFTGAHDGAKKLVQEVAVPAMPTSYLLGRDGRVRFIHQGYRGDATEQELRREIDALLAERKSDL